MYVLIHICFKVSFDVVKAKNNQKIAYIDIGGSNPIAFLDRHDITNKKLFT